MQTQTPASRTVILLIAFATASIVLAIAVYVSFGGTTPFVAQGYRFGVPLPDAGNLVQGSDVQIAGVNVGTVRQVVRTGDRALATVEIQPQFAPIRTGARAIMRTKTLLGEAYIELVPGPRTAPAIPDTGQLAQSRVQTTVSLDQFLQTFNPRTLQDMRDMFAGFASALRGRSQSLNVSFGRLAPFSQDMAGVMQTLNSESAQLQQMFASSGIVMHALGQRVGDLQTAVTAGNDVFATTAARNRSLEATMRALPGFLDQARATSQTMIAESGDFNGAMRSMVPVGALLYPSLTAVRNDLPPVGQLFHDLPATMRAGERGFPALTRILNAMTPAFASLYPGLRQFIPVVRLFADYGEEAVIAPLANGAAAYNGTEVGPGGKIIDRPGTGIYVSNESIAGWTKRLPTNRANPYPTPDGTASVAKVGFLKSFDCRNVNNPQYLPPTGSGVPPCVEQGPWSYLGKTAYYPRLQPAGP